MTVEKMLELQLLGDIMEMMGRIRGERFEFEGNLYRKAAIEARYKKLFAEFIEPFMVAQTVEAVDITEESD